MNNKILFLIITILGISVSVTDSQYQNFRIHPSSNNQIEPTIVVHPVNSQILFASAFTIRQAFRSESVYVSTNGGLNWTGTDTCPGAPIANHGGDPGPVIDKDGRFLLTHQGGFVLGMYANYSTNLGQSWSNNYTIASNDQDKGSSGTDDVPASPYYGRTYLVWTKYTNPFPIAQSFTSNGGISWSSLTVINNNSGHISQGPALSVNNQGNVYVTWAASIQNSPFTEDYIGLAFSSNGGVNWNVRENIFECNGIRTSSLQPWSIRVNSFPSIEIDKSSGNRSNWIYIVTTEKNLPPAGTDPDIIFHRSTDNGVTWSSSVRVNQDLLNNGKVQYFPSMKVDEFGGINIVYYDNRNTTFDSMGVYLSRSTDGGFTWKDYAINEHNFKPKAIAGTGGGNQGDNIGITYTNGKLFPVWMDDFSGVYQIWTASIDIQSIGIKKINNETPPSFKLRQNFPNPFNPATKIIFEIPFTKIEGSYSSNLVKVNIYDILGKHISTLVNKNMDPGIYEVEWSDEIQPSGLYFYKLEAKNLSLTKKMIKIK